MAPLVTTLEHCPVAYLLHTSSIVAALCNSQWGSLQYIVHVITRNRDQALDQCLVGEQRL
jgi:hypothetical protein